MPDQEASVPMETESAAIVHFQNDVIFPEQNHT
jgi:hypothetical protein